MPNPPVNVSGANGANISFGSLSLNIPPGCWADALILRVDIQMHAKLLADPPPLPQSAVFGTWIITVSDPATGAAAPNPFLGGKMATFACTTAPANSRWIAHPGGAVGATVPDGGVAYPNGQTNNLPVSSLLSVIFP